MFFTKKKWEKKYNWRQYLLLLCQYQVVRKESQVRVTIWPLCLVPSRWCEKRIWSSSLFSFCSPPAQNCISSTNGQSQRQLIEISQGNLKKTSTMTGMISITEGNGAPENYNSQSKEELWTVLHHFSKKVLSESFIDKAFVHCFSHF